MWVAVKGKGNADARTVYESDHELFRMDVRKCLQHQFVPNIDRWEADGVVERSLWNTCGGAGYVNKYMIACLWRDARIERMVAGCSEIMLDISARAVRSINAVEHLWQLRLLESRKGYALDCCA